MGREIHLHSMVVHAVIALAAVGAGAFALDAAGALVAGVAPGTWTFLWKAAVALTFLAALPATLTGITERSHMYVNWHRSHKAKLVLSLLLVALTGAEIVAAAHLGGRAVAIGSPLGLAVVAGNPVVCLALSFYGSGARRSRGRRTCPTCSRHHQRTCWKAPRLTSPSAPG